MSIWDPITEQEENELERSKNIYLIDSEKGLELIARLLKKSPPQINRKAEYLDHLIDNHLINIIGKVGLNNVSEISRELLNISDKITNTNRFNLLYNKTIIGVGGRFSAGKSKFINSIMNTEEPLLPEDQDPLTSIPTYIVYGKEDMIYAHTHMNQEVEIDVEGMKALTHAFFRKYGIGFSKTIKNIAIKSKRMKYIDLAFLDTPGYNKADIGVNSNESDYNKAFTNLRGIDFLIWLIDIESGGVLAEDIEFIKKVNVTNPILIIMNKADKKTEIKPIISNSIKVLQNAKIKIYGVTAYSSFERKEYAENKIIEQYLKQASNIRNRVEDVKAKLLDIIYGINNNVANKISEYEKQRNIIGDAILKSNDILFLKTLAEIYSTIIAELNRTKKSYRKFQENVENIMKELQLLINNKGNAK